MLSRVDHEKEISYFKEILGIESLDQIVRSEQGGIGSSISHNNLSKELDLLKKGLSQYDILIFESKGILSYNSLGPSSGLIFSKLVIERLSKGNWYKKEGLNFITISDKTGYKRENKFQFRYSIPLRVSLKKETFNEGEIIFENWGDLYELEISRLCISPLSFLSIKTKSYEKCSTINGYKIKRE
ncbi:hypothetical protein HN385_05885 [archaeon]|jgi:hypothetical protein|nr:hypothetical protein [archaeon]MBT3451110.1 hypothetical protein [archaeon]MBT6868646.1 hypothetical protein [archaeon]MBT7193387.1 hypothetical protein [archaeon]MBT7381443.1 hypothetical protein [archaeon]